MSVCQSQDMETVGCVYYYKALVAIVWHGTLQAAWDVRIFITNCWEVKPQT